MVILGGAGSQAGVVLGAVIVSVLLEVLRDPGDARSVFYVAILLALVAAFRASWQLAAVLGGTVVFGVVAHLVAGGIDDSWTSGSVEASGSIGAWASDWVIVPANLAAWIPPVSYVGLVALALVLTLAPRLGPDRAARADAVPRRVRLGERDARAARSRRGTSCSARCSSR